MYPTYSWSEQRYYDKLKDIINNEINSVSDNPLILKNGKVEYSDIFMLSM